MENKRDGGNHSDRDRHYPNIRFYMVDTAEKSDDIAVALRHGLVAQHAVHGKAYDFGHNNV